MTKQQAIERITAYLPHLDETVLTSVLTLLERVQPELDAWELEMQADAETGKLDELIDAALDELAQGDAGDLFEGFDARHDESAV